ncbi:MAG: class I SAM-dependent methyltransferase [Candidatus Diapherotrites archaeon]|nr:class I SAM-dependent methyltransferase [Candidatus Diapherotrites archaeon]
MQGYNAQNFSSHSQIVNLAGGGNKIIEFGCGKGFVTEQLQKHGNKVTGVEINTENAKRAKKFCSKIFIGDIEKMDFRKLGSGFDVALFGDVLEHLKNPEGTLGKTGRILGKNGRVIASIPNIANWKIRLGLLGGKFDYAEQGILDKTHLKFFTLKNAKKLFNENNFVIEKILTVPSAPVPGSSAKRLLSKLVPGLFSFQFVIVAKVKK